jgi:hypothetical protein
MSEEQYRHTPFNTPMPQWQPPAPQDPTATRLVEGGSLKLNPLDREGLEEWFRQSFKRQVADENSWFSREWFPQLLVPLYRSLNSNFNETIDLIDKSNEDVLKLREEVLIEVAKASEEMAAEVVKARADMKKEMVDWINVKNKEFTAEVAKMRQRMVDKCNDDLNVMREDLLRVLRMEMLNEICKESGARDVKSSEHIQSAVDTTHAEMMTAYNADVKSMHAEILDVLRRELAQEIVKMRKAKQK